MIYPNIKYYVEYYEGYYYYIQKDDLDYYITKDCVSIDFDDGAYLELAIKPEITFPNSKSSLQEEELLYILNLPLEGQKLSPEEADLAFKNYAQIHPIR